MRYILGCDPGINGAIAILDDDGKLVEVFDMPTHELKIGKSIKRRISPELLVSELRGKSSMIDIAYLEHVSSSPQMGCASSFSFGESFGIVRGIFAAMHIPVQLVTPAKWKRDIGINASKDGARLKATQIWPEDAGEFKRVKDHGKAESALIALWGERHCR